MAKNAETPSVQLVDGQGNFNQAELESFVRTVKLAECGLSYAVVAIMGPQSSGKSTLMNHLFHTSFREMDAYRGRFQTTQGIWLAKAVGIDPCTLAMDLEGTDGRERGEDDTTFERQSSLFALAVADIVLINMWCHDIGREHAANKPLLKTVFQVMMRLFTPRKTTLLFVIRDKTKTPFEILEPILREDIQKIWESVAKPSKYTETPLSEFFNVQVTALSSFEEKEEEFKEQVSLLRQQFYNSIAPGGLAGDRRTVIPGSGFPLSAQEIWKVIKENKDLDLPAHKVMVATVRCDEIANEKFHELISYEEWQNLLEDTKIGPVAGFGKMMNALLDKCLSGYDAEAAYFESSVRDAKRASLLGRCLEAVQPMYQAVLGHYRVKAFEKFKTDLARSIAERHKGFADTVRYCVKESLNEFDEGCHDAHIKLAEWDITKIREKLCRDIDAHTSVTRAEKLSKITSGVEHHLEETLTASAASLLDSASSDTWAAMTKLLSHEVEVAEANFLSAISGFELKEMEQDKMVARLRDFGREIVLKKAREEAGQVLIRMKDRFNTVFTRDADSMPRIWSAEHDVREITKDARIKSLKLLAVLAAVRLEDGNSVDIETTLMTLIGEPSEVPQEASVNTTATDNRSLLSSASSALASSTWDGVLPEYTLITPIECRSIWRQFKAETEYTISQALAAQEASKRGASWLPPPWAIVAMIFLGFNEFMAVVRNPIYLIVMFVLYLVGKALWVQLNVRKEFEHGMLTGLISVSTKLLPTFMNIMKRLVNEGHQHGREDDAVRGRAIPLQDFPSDLSTTDRSLNGSQSVAQGVRQRQTNTTFQT